MNKYALLGLVMLLSNWMAAGAEPEFKVYQVVQVKEAPKIDGVLDDPCWSNTVKISGFTQVILASGPAREQTSVAMVSDGEALYLGIECADTNIVAKAKEHDGAVCADDCIEIFIDPGNSHKQTYQFVVNTIGVQYEGSQEQESAWNGLWEAKVKTHEKGWWLEVRIPFSSLGLAVKNGDIWGLNVCRENYVSGSERYSELSCWSDTGGGFNAPERFGHIVFGTYADCLKDNLLPEMEKQQQKIESFMKQHPEAAKDCEPKYEQTRRSIREIKDAIGASNVIAEKEFIELYQKSETTLKKLSALMYELQLAVLLLE